VGSLLNVALNLLSVFRCPIYDTLPGITCNSKLTETKVPIGNVYFPQVGVIYFLLNLLVVQVKIFLIL
jgi:hypothetical protein